MNNKYIIINKTLLEKRIEELEKERVLHEKVDIGMFDSIWAAKTSQAIDLLIEVLSLSTPLIPDIKDIQLWLSKQSYQKEYGEQEYMMYYDVDIPKIIQDYISNLKLDV